MSFDKIFDLTALECIFLLLYSLDYGPGTWHLYRPELLDAFRKNLNSLDYTEDLDDVQKSKSMHWYKDITIIIEVRPLSFLGLLGCTDSQSWDPSNRSRSCWAIRTAVLERQNVSYVL